jgi:hypothetical protein
MASHGAFRGLAHIPERPICTEDQIDMDRASHKNTRLFRRSENSASTTSRAVVVFARFGSVV